jgi:hypothetical protein
VTDDDVRASGETDREALRDRAAHSGPINDHTMISRIEFHVVERRRCERDPPTGVGETRQWPHRLNERLRHVRRDMAAA